MTPDEYDITSIERAKAELKKYTNSKLTQTKWLRAAEETEAELKTNAAMLEIKKKGYRQIATQPLHVPNGILIIIYYEV